MSGGENLFGFMVLTFLCIGIYTVRFGYDENKCEMTYMYEHPQYAKVPFEDSVKTAFPRYNLYLYGEGRYFQQVKDFKLSGVPVLYIPGHGGSYKQARSIGSVLLWKHIHKPGINHFNVFTVDLNEELVAFYGGTLQEQTEFVRNCIKKILSLYENESKPKSVAIVGHSMGGILARGVFALSDFDHTQVNTVIMLATPNLAPVVNVDRFISTYYENVNSYWQKHAKTLKHVTVVSIGGGPMDYQVPQSLTRLPRNSSVNTYSTVATSVPRVYVSAEHQTIVWCNQLVLVTARFLVDMLSAESKQLTEDVAQRTRLLNYHFRQNPGSGIVPKSDKGRKVRLSASYDWSEIEDFLWSLDKNAAGQGTYYSFSIDKFVDMNSPIFVSRTDSKREKWILACRMTETEKCKEATDLSNQAFASLKYRIIHLDLKAFQENGFSHIIFPMTKSSATTFLDVNSLSELEESTSVVVPHVFSNLWTWNSGHVFGIAHDQSPLRFYYKVHLNGFQNIYQAFRITALGESNSQHLRFQVPWDDGQTQYGENSMVATLHSTPENANDSAILHIYGDSNENLKIEVKVDFFQVLGGIVRYLGFSLPIYVLANVVQVYMYQMNQMQAGKPCHSISDVLSVAVKPYKVQPFLSIFRSAYNSPNFAAMWTAAMLSTPDHLRMEENQLWFGFAPLFLFLFGTQIFNAMRLLQTVLMQVVSPVLLMLSRLPFVQAFTDSAIFKTIFHSLVLGVCLNVCSSFAFLYMFLASFLSVCFVRKIALTHPFQKEQDKQNKEQDTQETKPDEIKKDEDKEEVAKDEKTVEKNHTDKSEKSEEVAKPPIKKEPDPTSPQEDCFNVNFILLQLWMWLFLFSLPSLGVMFVNFRSNMALPVDPFLEPAVVASLLFVIQTIYPGFDGVKTSHIKFLSWLKFPAMVMMVMMCQQSLYRAPYFILGFLTVHTLTQIF